MSTLQLFHKYLQEPGLGTQRGWTWTKEVTGTGTDHTDQTDARKLKREAGAQGTGRCLGCVQGAQAQQRAPCPKQGWAGATPCCALCFFGASLILEYRGVVERFKQQTVRVGFVFGKLFSNRRLVWGQIRGPRMDNGQSLRLGDGEERPSTKISYKISKYQSLTREEWALSWTVYRKSKTYNHLNNMQQVTF